MNATEILGHLGGGDAAAAWERAQRHLPFWVSVALVLALSWYLARLAWALLPGPPSAGWIPPAVTGAAAGAGQQRIDASRIVAAHLFGVADAQPVPVDDTVVDAPDTRLNLQLRATVAADDASGMAHAIIADGSRNEKVYFIKDTVPGGATLHQVLPDRVILNRGGVLEALRLPREASGTEPAPRRRAATGRAPTVQQLVTQNAANFNEIVRPQPYMPGGKLKGYRLYPGRQRSLFNDVGLQPGDLLTAVNGIPLNNPAESMQIFAGLNDSTQVTLTIERNKQTQELRIDTSQLASLAGNNR